MKKLSVIFAVLLFGLSFSQKYSGIARFVHYQYGKEDVIEDASQNIDLDINNYSTAELVNIFIQRNLNVLKVKGSGRITSLLSLEIDENGILKNVSAMGENNSLNEEVISMFEKYKERKMVFKNIKNTDVEILIPITIAL